MRLIHIYTFVLILSALAHAETNLTIGTCQTFLLFNETSNSTQNETICAQPFNFQNISLNASDPLNSLYLNNTRNLSVSCGGNQTVLIQNITNVTNITQNITNVVANCNLSTTITPTASLQRINNSTSGLDITFEAIPQNYCYENRYETAIASTVFRSDRCNDTFIVNLPPPQIQFVNQTVEKECPEAPICPAPDNSSDIRLSECNIMLREANSTVQNYVIQINESRNEVEKINKTLLLYSDATRAGINAASAATQPWNDLFSVLVVGAGIAVAAWVYRIRTPLSAHSMPPAQTAESLNSQMEYLKKRKEEILKR